MPRQAVVFAGGRGVRLAPLTDNVPKPLVQVNGRPFLHYLIELLRDAGFTRIVLLLGYRAPDVEEYVGSGSPWGVTITCVTTPPDMHTLGRMRNALPLLDDVVLTAYCDNFVPLRAAEMVKSFFDRDAVAQLTAYANEDRFTRNNLRVETDGRVSAYDPSRDRSDLNRVDIGFALVDLTRLRLPTPADDNVAFEHAVYPALAAQGSLYAHVTRHRYYGVGSIERIPAAERFFARQPTVVLDRDGVLNVRAPAGEYVTRPEDFVWAAGALTALRRLSEAGYRLIIVTNQAGIARGMLSSEDLAAIHRKLLSDAAAAGARIARIYHCPHGWDDGCGCRKPAPGMLLAAQREYDLDLSRTTFIGDDDRDRAAADRAGCRYEAVDEGRPLIDVIADVMAQPAEEGRRV